MSMGGAAIGEMAGKAVDQILTWQGAKKAREAQFEANEKNAELQRDFAQHGITWKVDDAKRAGLHPLYAIGAAGASASPSFQAFTGVPQYDFAGMGQSLGRAVDASSSSESDRAIKSAQLKVLESEAERNFAQAQAARSEDQRAWLNTWTSRPINLDGSGIRADPFWALSSDAIPHRMNSAVGTDGIAQGSKAGAVKYKPSEIVSHERGEPSRSAGTGPAYSEFTISPWGLKARGYQSQEGYGESRENMGNAQFILENVAYYGIGWLKRYVSEVLLGQPPGKMRDRQILPEDDMLNRWKKGSN